MDPYAQCAVCGAITHNREGANIHYRREHSEVAEMIKTHDITPTDLMRCNVCGIMMSALSLFEHFLMLHATPVLQLIAKANEVIGEKP